MTLSIWSVEASTSRRAIASWSAARTLTQKRPLAAIWAQAAESVGGTIAIIGGCADTAMNWLVMNACGRSSASRPVMTQTPVG
jgi:hypothetical protein